MHLRFLSCRDLNVVDSSTGDNIATISDILIHPDRGSVEGFFVFPEPGYRFGDTDIFLSVNDIVRWGKSVSVSSLSALSPASELIRLSELLLDDRTVIGQKMVSERGRRIGRCKDVQFSTKTWKIEWLFPKRLLGWGVAYPATDIVEIRSDAIILRDDASSKEPVTMVQPDAQDDALEDLTSPIATPSTRNPSS